MWGNKPGWLISALIAVLMGVILYVFGTPGSTTPPTGEFPKYAKPLEPPIKPETVVTILTEKRDAGDQYWQAIDEYKNNKRDYDSFFTPKEKNFSRLKNLKQVEPAMKLLLAAAPAQDARIFIRKPELLVNYKYPYPDLDALSKLGRIAGQIGLSHGAANQLDEAERYYNAEFSLGKKLFDERINTTEMIQGVGLLREASAYLASLAGKRKDAARKAQVEAFDQQLKGWYGTDVDKLTKVIPSLGGQDIAKYAGDIFQFATSSPDRMVRVEALLKIGRYKYNAATHWDQVWAKRYLTSPARVGQPDPAEDPDPAVRLAAQVARDLTAEGYRQIDVTD